MKFVFILLKHEQDEDTHALVKNMYETPTQTKIYDVFHKESLGVIINEIEIISLHDKPLRKNSDSVKQKLHKAINI